MKILHVASFCGNIGDNASHLGLYAILHRIVGQFKVDQLEMRDFYKNRPLDERRYFDGNFAALANKYDLLIFGGGGFLDYWVENSASGTTIDMTIENLAKIKVPTLFASMGSHPHKTVPEGNIEKFRHFLTAIGEKPNMRVLPRNDGSIDRIKSILGETEAGKFREILDNGFFFEPANTGRYTGIAPGKYIAWNITTDQLQMNKSLQKQEAAENFYQNIARTIIALAKTSDLSHVFVPHIGADINAIAKLFAYLPDDLMRRRIVIAPYGQGDEAAKFAFNVYRESHVTIGTRFHANVCSLAMGGNTIGLGVLDRIKYVYDYFAIPDRCIDVTEDFDQQLFDTVLAPFPHTSIRHSLAERKVQSMGTYAEAIKAITS